MEKKRIKKVAVSKPVVKKKSKVKTVRSVKVVKATSSPEIAITPKIKNERAFSFLGFMNDFAQALVITAVLILLTVSFLIVGGQQESKKVSKGGQGYFDILEDVKVVKKGKEFFGTLMTSTDSSRESDSSAGMGAGGNLAVQSGEKVMSGVSVDMGIMPPMELIKYNYVYVGDDFTLFPSEADVYKRINPDLSKEFSSAFSNKKISFFDMSKFRDISVVNVSINEDVDYGYSIYLGLKDGSFSIYKNWDRWPNMEKSCRGYDSACYESYQLSVEDVLDDETIINISDQFLLDYGISLNNYGAGEVQKYWLQDYARSSVKESFYIPDTVSVVYPLKIEGRNVYEEYGQTFGLTIEVDMREKKVSSVFNLFYQHYESSSYSTENNKDIILKMVSQGGMYPDYSYYEEGADVKEVTVEIGTPSLEMVKLWHYDNEKMIGSEIYVPAYVFPIISGGEEPYFYKKNIVIPAVKDFFETNRYIVPLTVSEDGTTSSPEIEIIEPIARPTTEKN
jgi:hypothetical protein